MLHLWYTTHQMQKLIGATMGAGVKLTDSNTGGKLVAHLWGPEHLGSSLEQLGRTCLSMLPLCPGHPGTSLHLSLIEEKLW